MYKGRLISLHRLLTFFILLLLVLCMVFAGCSADTLKRTAYETLQNINQQDCEKDLSTECPERESYEAYQRKQDEL